MAIVINRVGSIESVDKRVAPALTVAGSSSRAWARGYEYDPLTYAAIYRTQPNVRTCVDFLARNLAQLGIHVFRRVSDTDRQRLADHELARWLNHPSDHVTRYRLIETLLQDLGIFWNAYWLKVREGAALALQRLPPYQIAPVGGLVPSSYEWTLDTGEVYTIPSSEIVAFHGYHPTDALLGLSPLETLRRVLAEDMAATEQREAFWKNAARIEGVVERPLAAKTWDPTQIDSFKAQWAGNYAGVAGTGRVPVLQEGMTFKSIAFSPRQAEYVNARKLTREEVASAYHIPLPMVGILDHATYSNVREQHKQLYQDTLGPWCEWLAEEIERQLLVECADRDRVYVEFNIAEKLSGSFEEQAASLRALVGRPLMTANEGRARLNLPALDEPGADALVRPLNTTTDQPDDAAVAQAIAATWARQASVLGKAPADSRAQAFDESRWTRELAADLVPIYARAGFDEFNAHKRARQLAFTVNGDTRTRLEAGIAAFGPDREASDYVP